MNANEHAKEILKRIKPIYTLRTIIRYNPRLRIKDESVAEHIAFVALLVTELYKDYKFNLEKSLLMALFHDIAEVQISDIPHPVKQRFPKIALALHEAELEVLNEWGQFQARDLVHEFEMMETTEALIVNLADAISVQLYANSEISLGNSTFQEVKDIIDDRVIKLFDRIPKEAER